MKDLKYEYCLINHDKQIRTSYIININCCEVEKWIEKQNNEDYMPYLKWKVSSGIMKFNICRLVCHLISKLYKNNVDLSLNQLQDNCNILDFVEIKRDIMCNKKIININNEGTTLDNQIYKSCEYIRVVLERGTKPNNWKDAFNYKQTIETFVYNYDKKNNKLIDITNFNNCKK